MTPAPAPEHKASLKDRLLEKANTSPEKANRIKLDVSYDQDMDELTFTCSGLKLVEAIKKSSTGDSEGLMMDLSGDFLINVDGAKFVVSGRHARGNGAWLAYDVKVSK